MTPNTNRKKQPSRGIPRRKEQYRLWFEFLKLAHQSDKPIIQQALKASAAFYGPWEIDKYEKFDDWWKDKSNLFNDTLEVRKLEAGALPDTPECLVVQIPLNRTQSELLAAVRKVLAQHYDDIGKTSRKNRALATSAYGLTGKGEIKTDAVRETLSVYRDVKLRNRSSLKGKKLLAAMSYVHMPPGVACSISPVSVAASLNSTVSPSSGRSTPSKCSARKRSLEMLRLENTSSYVAEIPKRRGHVDLLTDPSLLDREERALQVRLA